MQLQADPSRLSSAYQGANPFPHIVVDGLFPEDVLDPVLAEFPGPDAVQWQRFDNDKEKKLGSTYRTELPSHVRDFLYFMNSAPLLEFLETLTGIDGLISDPYYGGAGLHQILRGGHLAIHADFNWHPRAGARLARVVEYSDTAHAVVPAPPAFTTEFPRRYCSHLKESAPLAVRLYDAAGNLLWRLGPYTDGQYWLLLGDGVDAYAVPAAAGFEVPRLARVSLRVHYRSPAGWDTYSPPLSLTLGRQAQAVFRRP
jgi:hypothetical protein